VASSGSWARTTRELHKWRNWQGIADLVPIAVVDRSGKFAALASIARSASRASGIPRPRPPARRPKTAGLDFLHGIKSPISSPPCATDRSPRRHNHRAESGLRRFELLTPRTYLKACGKLRAETPERPLQRKEYGPCPPCSLSAPSRRRPEPVSKVRPDTAETIRLISPVSMTTRRGHHHHDLRGKTSIGDYMVVDSGRSNAMWVRWPIMCSTTSRRPAFPACGRRHAELRLVLIDAAIHRPCLSPEVARSTSGEDVGRRARQGRDAQAKVAPATPFV